MKLIKTINSKAQDTLNQLTGLVAFTIIIGLAGSYEVERINGMQLLTQLITTACIGFTAYMLLSYVNIIVANKLDRMYHDKNNGLSNNKENNNKNFEEIA